MKIDNKLREIINSWKEQINEDINNMCNDIELELEKREGLRLTPFQKKIRRELSPASNTAGVSG